MEEPMNDTVPTGQEETELQETMPEDQIDPELVEIQKEAGTELYDDDPELELLDRAHGNFEFYQSVGKAAEAKKQRLDVSPEPRTPPHLVSDAPTRRLPDNMSVNQMWKNVQHKK